MRSNLCAFLAVMLAASPIYLGGRLMKALSSFGLLLATLVFSISARAVTIPTVPVGNPGNPADPPRRIFDRGLTDRHDH
jgi:hypothetical protein